MDFVDYTTYKDSRIQNCRIHSLSRILGIYGNLTIQGVCYRLIRRFWINHSNAEIQPQQSNPSHRSMCAIYAFRFGDWCSHYIDIDTRALDIQHDD